MPLEEVLLRDCSYVVRIELLTKEMSVEDARVSQGAQPWMILRQNARL